MVTKIDMCPPNVLQENLKVVTRVLKSPGCRKIPIFVQSYDDVITCATNFTSERSDVLFVQKVSVCVILCVLLCVHVHGLEQV